MLGLMQDWPLLCHRIIDHAAIHHGERPVVTRSVEGPIHTTNYAEIRARALKVAQRLDKRRHQARRPRRDAGLEHLAAPRSLVRHPGHRRGLPHGQSAPVPRPDRLDHQSRRRPRDDRRPHLRAAAGEARRQAAEPIERYVVLTDAAHMPETTLKNAVPYEEWIGEVDGDFAWKTLRREHRRRHVLHLRHHRQSQGRALLAPLQRAARDDGGACPTPWAVASRDVVLPVVPMFHANGWALALLRADGRRRRWCMPGAKLDGASIYELLDDLQGDVHRRGADGVADAAAASRSRPTPSCRI